MQKIIELYFINTLKYYKQKRKLVPFNLAHFLEDQTLEAMWGHYKSALDFATREVLGKRLCAKKPWISQATLLLLISAGKLSEGEM